MHTKSINYGKSSFPPWSICHWMDLILRLLSKCSTPTACVFFLDLPVKNIYPTKLQWKESKTYRCYENSFGVKLDVHFLTVAKIKEHFQNVLEICWSSYLNNITVKQQCRQDKKGPYHSLCHSCDLVIGNEWKQIRCEINVKAIYAILIIIMPL